MKRIALALAFLIGSIVSAAAACTSPAVMHDFPGTSFNMSLATVPDGNCGSNVAVTTWGGGALGGMANYGTSPGAVLVPGVNAFITNTPNVGQSGAPWSQNLTQIVGSAPSATNPLWEAAAQATVSAGNTLNAVTANTNGTSIPVTGYGAVLININCSVNCSGGTQVNLQGADVSGTFGPTQMISVSNATPAGASAPGAVTGVTNQSGQAYFCARNFGFTNMRLVVAGYSAGTISGTITPINAPGCDPVHVANAAVPGGASPAAGSPVTPANQYSNYETVAASQTGQAMGATGATGDYLSHCVVYPQTTSPGVVTVFDGTSSAANNVIAFAGGASSVSNLSPFAIPVGSFSLNGAWKVTTGANVIVTCHGKFT